MSALSVRYTPGKSCLTALAFSLTTIRCHSFSILCLSASASSFSVSAAVRFLVASQLTPATRVPPTTLLKKETNAIATVSDMQFSLSSDCNFSKRIRHYCQQFTRKQSSAKVPKSGDVGFVVFVLCVLRATSHVRGPALRVAVWVRDPDVAVRTRWRHRSLG